MIASKQLSNMTPSQRERKRVRDREFQRTLRTRRKCYTAWLEKEVQRLQGEIVSNDTVEDLRRRNAALSAELSHLRARIDMTLSGSLRTQSTEAFENYSSSAYETVYASEISPYSNYVTNVAGSSSPDSRPSITSSAPSSPYEVSSYASLAKNYASCLPSIQLEDMPKYELNVLQLELERYGIGRSSSW